MDRCKCFLEQWMEALCNKDFVTLLKSKAKYNQYVDCFGKAYIDGIGDYLLFALAYRWISKIVCCANPHGRKNNYLWKWYGVSLARYNDSLTLEQLIVAHNKIKANAASLYNEAQLLFENEMYARSYFLLCIASEELGKSIIVISAIVDLMAEEINWRSFWKKLRNHKQDGNNRILWKRRCVVRW